MRINELEKVLRLAAAMQVAIAGPPALRQIQRLGETLRAFDALSENVKKMQITLPSLGQ